MKIISRIKWGSRNTNPEAHQGVRSIRKIFIHWTESASGQTNYAQQCDAMRGLQSFHMDTRGWSDLGYHFVVFQPYGKLRSARVFQGRKLDCVPAAQANHNTNTCAIAVVMNHNDKLKWQTRLAIRRLVYYLRRKRIVGDVPVRPHSDVTATTCPGPKLTWWVRKTY